MRYEKGSFIVVPNQKNIAGCAPYVQSVYMWLCFHANQDGECFPSLALIAKESGASRRGVILAIEVLIARRIIEKETRKNGKENLTNVYRLLLGGSEYHAPGGEQSALPGAQEHLPVVHKVHRELNPIELNKINSIYSFEDFWNDYPRKIARKKAEQIYSRLSEKTRLAIKQDLPKRKETDSWQRNFIPHPTTYLNGERWNDEITISSPVNGPSVVRI